MRPLIEKDISETEKILNNFQNFQLVERLSSGESSPSVI